MGVGVERAHKHPATMKLRRLQVDNETLIVVLIAVIGLVITGIVVMIASRAMRSRKLREKFGPEYDYTMKKVGDQRAAEEALEEREKRVSKLNLRALDPNEWDHYHERWIEIQSDFVDKPSESVQEANELIKNVMAARGFPVADFEQRTADISVLYPDFVSNYRSAHAIALKNQPNGGVSTEELRQAMVHYRALFEELLETAENKVKENTG
jgi:hypothetical protein